MKATLTQHGGGATDAELWIGYGPVRDALRLRLTTDYSATGEPPQQELATLTLPYADAERLARHIFNLLGLTPPAADDDPVVGHFTDD